MKVKSKSRALPFKMKDNIRIPRKSKKLMKKRLGLVGYSYWYFKYFKPELNEK